MGHLTESRLHRARRHGARGLVALLAGLAVTAAWSSQKAGGTIGKVDNSGSTSTSTPAPKAPTTASSGVGKAPTKAASGTTR
ncbi:hypothetical protein [Scleromatobacter humisilvae]|uniref:Uncharacterized protein n=1 Tax=Scleromatobacter humisilvae TaxID=2897159 RepID=A0A9X1YN30_9BURK|nr:hypothetical protein [Scleromatobacter humisilvae]MCK9688500.1 hypothetical protein [Scleromatobacter humisilvae]